MWVFLVPARSSSRLSSDAAARARRASRRWPPQYSLADFGVDEADVSARFGPYKERFGLNKKK